MLSFTQWLSEKPLPKSADLSTVSGSNHIYADGLPELGSDEQMFWGKYITALSNWVSGDASPYFIKAHKIRIPRRYQIGGELYRGYGFQLDDPMWRKEVRLMLKKGIGSSEVESWTRKKKMGIMFADINQFGDKVDIGFTIVKKFPNTKIIVDIRKFVLDREIVKIGAATPFDTFTSIKATKIEHEVVVERTPNQWLKITDKIFVYGHVRGKKFTKADQFIQAANEWLDRNEGDNYGVDF